MSRCTTTIHTNDRREGIHQGLFTLGRNGLGGVWRDKERKKSSRFFFFGKFIGGYGEGKERRSSSLPCCCHCCDMMAFMVVICQHCEKVERGEVCQSYYLSGELTPHSHTHSLTHSSEGYLFSLFVGPTRSYFLVLNQIRCYVLEMFTLSCGPCCSRPQGTFEVHPTQPSQRHAPLFPPY